ncbi:MAG: hypothetical protein COT74_04510 [Bdellovibrionales bacterium CG10_big_fil_rev_8_21_14_0_10_45_34]|nr:MAG: hypothetical protein COT74_04510 [Bdellovibrionales bacterium CG10_big_fil_rev_8_21_14_0_10_45_34]
MRLLLGIVTLLFVTFGCAKKEQNPSNTTAQSTRVESPSASCDAKVIPGSYVVRWSSGYLQKLESWTSQEIDSVLVAQYSDYIELIEPNYRIDVPKTFSEASILSTQNSPDDAFWGVKNIEVEHVWSKGFYGQGVVVAVVDSGVDLTHPNLVGRIFTNTAELNGKEGVDDDGNGYVDDIYGYNFADRNPTNVDEAEHGTHVAGVIAANHDNNFVRGVAPQATILPADFMSAVSGSTASSIEAIDYSVKMGANIINASWGGPGCSAELKRTIEALAEKNVLFVTAAGNEGLNLEYYDVYPAKYNLSNQITVGALGTIHLRTWFSNFGNPVDVLAPGERIISTVPGGFSRQDGTSMAAPFVSGIAALYLSKYPQMKVSDLREKIVSSLVTGPYRIKTNGTVVLPEDF